MTLCIKIYEKLMQPLLKWLKEENSVTLLQGIAKLHPCRNFHWLTEQSHLIDSAEALDWQCRGNWLTVQRHLIDSAEARKDYTEKNAYCTKPQMHQNLTCLYK